MPLKPIDEISARKDFLLNIRKELHRKPELAFEEFNTAIKIIDLLKQFGFTEIYSGIGQTGVVGILRNGAGPTLAFRADLDALPVSEKTELEHASENQGVMHACGHDGHMAMLLGAADYLSTYKNFSGNLIFIFQPAEEQGAGAKLMLQNKPLNNIKIDAIFGMHNLPELAAGEIVISSGPVMAAVNEFVIEIIGNGCHAAMPHLGTNPILAAAALISAIEHHKAQWFSAFEPVVINTTVFQAGAVFNVVPDNALIKGTVRYLNPKLTDIIPLLIENLAEKIGSAYEVKTNFNYIRHCGATINNPLTAKFTKSVLTKYHTKPEQIITQRPVMISEDFSYFLQKIPGVYAFIGNGNSSSLHHSTYEFNDANLVIGASFYAYIARHAEVLGVSDTPSF